MYNQGFKSFDNVTIYTFLENKPTVKSILMNLAVMQQSANFVH